jgi:hypothetical protein
MSDQQDLSSSGGCAPGGEDERQSPAELRNVHQRLLRDGAAWRTLVPDDERLNARVRTLPMELPQGGAPRKRDSALGALPRPRGSHGLETESPMRRELARGEIMQSGTMRAIRAWAGGAVAIAVVALLAALLVRMASGQAGSGTGMVGTPAPTPGTTATHTPTIGSRYVTNAVTARGVDNTGSPVNPTSTFNVGEPVYLVVAVRNPPAGQHRLSIDWFLNGQSLNLPPSSLTTRQVTGSANVYVALAYPQGGHGAARIYWDLPTGNPTEPVDLYTDAFLAQTVAFEVQGPPWAATATPAPARTPTPGPTASAGAVPTQPPTPTAKP